MANKKDAYYFSHDANAQDDPKCMILIDQLGMEGYGIFWALIEKLRSEKDYKLPFAIIPSLARRWGTSKEKVETVVKIYGLFEIDDIDFFSARLIRSMNERSEKARINANKRWQQIENKEEDATAMPPQCDRINPHMQNDAIKGKERKVNESIIDVLPLSNKRFTKPNKGEIIDYLSAEHQKDQFTAMGITDKFFNYYESNGWKVGKHSMKNWKAALAGWLSREKDFSGTQKTDKQREQEIKLMKSIGL